MARLHGVTVKLYNRTVVSYDALNAPIYELTCEEVDNVLPGQPTSGDVIDSVDPDGKRADCVLGIPKGDTHNWTNALVEVWPGELYETLGWPVTGVQDLIPLQWDRNVRAARYSGKPEDWFHTGGL
ncbi:MAG: hypothetical protein IKG25_05815 [Mogibacterium sp.]|nr:hypothetical protein [Mogibacterium sp.]MBR4090411.1 hypothetical protein [Mogibacterium sp.]